MGVRAHLTSPRGHPRGVLAPVIGRILNMSNAGQNRLAVRAVQVEGHDRVLDKGYQWLEPVATLRPSDVADVADWLRSPAPKL